MKRALLEALIRARAEARAVVLATELKGSGQWLIDAEESGGAPAAVVAAARAALAVDRGQTIDAGGPVFLQVHNPPLRLIIVGAVHIAQPLSRIAALAGYGVTVVDPRGAFATSERFPGVAVSDAWPDEALEALKPDARSAVVTLTHDPKLDDAALSVALRSPAFYIGSLGSKKTHLARCHRLQRAGFADADIARIHGPVGLSIGALSPAEIAVAILGQIIATHRARAAAGKERAA